MRVERALGVRTRDRAIQARLLFVGVLKMRRAAHLVVAATVALTGLILGILPMAAAHADTGIPFVALTNQARSIEGLPPLADNAALAAVAQAQAARMSARNELYHNPNLSTDVCCWTGLGENVGYGGSITVLESAFLASPEHRANIMGHYNQIGIGIVTDANGLVWVSEVFRLTAGSSSKTLVVPATKATSKPAAKPATKRPVQVLLPTRVVAARPVVTPRPSVSATPTAVAAVAAVPVRTVPNTASRSLTTGRLPIAAARAWASQWAAMLLSPAAATTGADPVASVLSFAATTAASAAGAL